MSGRLARGLERFQALPRHRRVAALVGLVWVIVVTGYAIGFLGSAGPASRGTVFIDGLFFLVALVLPLMLLWLAARLAEELAYQRELIAALAELMPPLIEALQETRETLARHGPARPEAVEAAVRQGLAATSAARVEIDPRPALAGIAATQARVESVLGELVARARTAAPAPEPEAPARGRKRRRAAAEEAPQPDLPLIEEPEAPPLRPEAPPAAAPAPAPDEGLLNWPVLVRALNFPRDPDDHEGFRALKTALRHHSVAQMLQGAEDLLTLLAQHDIYVDDLPVEAPDPEAWRRFIAGQRGAEADAVGGIRDARALEIAGGLMKRDAIFCDTALFFHRRFDAVLSEFAHDADDTQLVELADTRSARAFMLLARVNGAFG